MKRYTFVFLSLLLFFKNSCLFGVDYKEWILKSDHLSNPEILQVLLSADMETQLKICKALGQRQDLKMDNLVSALIEAKSPACKPELLLEILLQSLLTIDYENEKIELWIELNPISFQSLVKNLCLFKNENLKTHIIHLMRYAEEQIDVKHYLASEAQKVISAIKKQRGQVTFYQKKELNEILETIDWWDNKDFFEFCISLIETCNDKELVKKARELAKKY